MKAKSHWVWTTKAQQESRGRHIAGTMVYEHWREEIPEFMVERGLAMEAEDYDYGDGQVDLLELL